MKFMNENDIEWAVGEHTRNTFPNRLGAALVLRRLAEWADNHSDGWASWPKPATAAARLMELAEPWGADADCSDEELAAAVRPVKAFLTRQNARPEDRELILRSATS